MSVIIVGVGDADFLKMNTLDADQNPLYSGKHGKYQQRDNVQFVPFNLCKNDPYRLARTTLEELPAQLTEFFQRKNIYPNPSCEEEREEIKARLALHQKGDLFKTFDVHNAELK